MSWQKRGLIFRPADHGGWLGTHAQLPVSLGVGAQRRIYFANRDELGRSRVGWVELDLEDPERPAEISPAPVLEPGPLGTFDDHGVYPASLVELADRLYLYTIGWNPGVRRPLFYATIGLAVSTDGGLSFEKLPAPIMARSEHDPCLVTSPCVLLDNGLWRMWYVSGLRWEDTSDGLHSYYHVKYAESDDGVEWRRDGRVAIDLQPGERNIARPCVVREGGLYRMWYSYDRDDGYRIGYAESSDGLSWVRLDEQSAIEPTPGGWDSSAQAYPWVTLVGDREVMLYNGNDFGREGFGLAERSRGPT